MCNGGFKSLIAKVWLILTGVEHLWRRGLLQTHSLNANRTKQIYPLLRNGENKGTTYTFYVHVYLIELYVSSSSYNHCRPTSLSGPGTPSVLWNAMIVPFLNMTIKGAIWYQGEANAGNERYLSKLSENHNIFDIGCTEFKL